MKHSLSLSPKALTLSTGHTRILKVHAIYKVWDYQRVEAAGSWEDVECVRKRFENGCYQEVYLPLSSVQRGCVAAKSRCFEVTAARSASLQVLTLVGWSRT